MAANVMTVYDGTRALGEIEDHTREGVRAWVGTGPDRKPLGTYPDRKNAMRAVSAADAAERALNEPGKRVSGLPE